MIDYRYISEIMMLSKKRNTSLLYTDPKIARAWAFDGSEDVFFGIGSNRYPIFYQNFALSTPETSGIRDLHLNNGDTITYDNGYPKGVIENSYTNACATIEYSLGKKYNGMYIPLFGFNTRRCVDYEGLNSYRVNTFNYIKHSDDNSGNDFPYLSYSYGKCLYNVGEPVLNKDSYSSNPFNIECIRAGMIVYCQIGYIRVFRDYRGKYEFVDIDNIDSAAEKGYIKDKFGYLSKEYFTDYKSRKTSYNITPYNLYIAKDEEKQNLIDYANANSLSGYITWINNKFFDENKTISVSDELLDIVKKLATSLKNDSVSTNIITVCDDFNDQDGCEEWEGSEKSDKREISINDPIYPIF